MWHVICPFRIAIVAVRRTEWTNVVRFTIVVPGQDLNILGREAQNLVPAIIPQEFRREDPVLAVRYLETVMGTEPRGNSCRDRYVSIVQLVL